MQKTQEERKLEMNEKNKKCKLMLKYDKTM